MKPPKSDAVRGGLCLAITLADDAAHISVYFNGMGRCFFDRHLLRLRIPSVLVISPHSVRV
jgi:hypothetical protein